MSAGKVTKISVGRLMNLGNYEHIRYEIEAEITDGQSASETLIGIENVLKGLSPRCPVDMFHFEQVKRKATTWNEQDWFRYNQESWQKDKEENDTEYAKLTAELEAWRSKQIEDRKLLDDLGAAVVRKDAKDDWDNDEN